MSTPSKEAVQAAERILRWHGTSSHMLTVDTRDSIATIIDSAFAEHRERVRRFVTLALPFVDAPESETAELNALAIQIAALKEPPHDPIA